MEILSNVRQNVNNNKMAPVSPCEACAWVRYLPAGIRFGNKSEAFSGEQRALFEETIDTDLAAIGAELE
jgi:hypothetical protein